MMRDQREYVALNNISGSNIMEAAELTYDRINSRIVESSPVSNSHYINIPTEFNPGIIPNMPVRNIAASMVVAFGRLISRCFTDSAVEFTKNTKDLHFIDLYVNMYNAESMYDVISSSK